MHHKAALDQVGAVGGPVRSPRLALREPDLAIVREALAALHAPSPASLA